MGKVAIYARVSTSEGKQDYERQISDLTKEIKYNGYKDDQIEIFAEQISGYKKKEDRPEITKLLNQIESNQSYFDCVYVTEVSRLGRNPRDSKEIIERISDCGVQISIQSPPLKTLNPDGSRNNIAQIMLSVAAEFADLEAKTTKSRMKSGKLQRAIDGRNSGNNPAFGYKSDENKILVKDPAEEIVVEKIFEMYSEGMGSDAIAQTLNQMGTPTRYNKSHANKEVKIIGSDLTKSGASIKWEGVTIRSILKNTIYIGQRKVKSKDAVKDNNGKVISPKEYMTVKAPQIISEDLFNQCNDILKNKSTRNFITTYEYLLRDLVYCGCCGKKYYGQYLPNPRAAKVYKCASYIRATGCGNGSINISLIESVIFNEFITSKTLLSYLENPNDLKIQVEKELKILKMQLKNINSDKEKKESEQSRLLDLYLSSPDMNPTLLNSKQVIINKELESIQDKLQLVNKEIFQKNRILANYDQERATIEMLIKAKNNRTELHSIYKQLIHKIVINQINKKYTLVTFYAKVKGVILPNTLKIIIDAGAVRNVGYGRTKEYKYIPTLSITNEPVFENNILKTDISELSNELNQIIEQANIKTKTKLPYQFEIVPKENWLYISESDL